MLPGMVPDSSETLFDARRDGSDDVSERLARSQERRQKKRQDRQELLTEFLVKNKFVDVNIPVNLPSTQKASHQWWNIWNWARQPEPERMIYPIHIAAWLGKSQLVRILLEKGADPNPEPMSSTFLTPLELAREANNNGSHLDVIALLEPKA